MSTVDPECICRGNWRDIVKEHEPFIGTRYEDARGREFIFFGIVHTDEDYYYGMGEESGQYRLLSCVGSLQDHGMTAIDGPRPEGKTSLEVLIERINRQDRVVYGIDPNDP